MSILFIHHSGIWGGGTLSCFDITSMLKSEADIKLALPEGDNEAKRYARAKRFSIDENAPCANIFRYYSGGPSLIKVVLNYLITIKNRNKWTSYINGEKPDIIFLNSIVLWPMLKVFHAKNIPTVLFIRETIRGNPRSFINQIIRRFINKYGYAVAFLSEYDANQWQFDKKIKCFIVPDSVDVPRFEQEGQQIDFKQYSEFENRKHILFAGGINRIKGTDVAIQSVLNCKTDAELYILGDCDQSILHANLIKKIIKLKKYRCSKKSQKLISSDYENRIKLVGIAHDMSSWYKSCELCLIPNTEPHQSRSIYEAGVFSHPVIISNFKNYSEYVSDGINGLSVDVRSIEKWASSIDLVFENNLIEKLGSANREKTVNKHSFDTTKCILRDILKSLER